ncbi:hypothetical protein AB0J35_61235 [Nonomuraea angiospora]
MNRSVPLIRTLLGGGPRHAAERVLDGWRERFSTVAITQVRRS